MLHVEAFQYIQLDEQNHIFTGQLPSELIGSTQEFEKLWALRPTYFHEIEMYGRKVHTPRWQQAFGANYRYSGAIQNALPVDEALQPYQAWCQKEIDANFNGLLLNWYDGQLKHYIGAHRDDTRDLVAGHPIVSISMGEERIFRLRPWKQKGHQDFVMPHGSLVIIPWETNLNWTHEVPHFAKYTDKRISITLRVFDV